MQSQKEGINVSGIEEDLQAATDKYNKARQHVRFVRLTTWSPRLLQSHVATTTKLRVLNAAHRCCLRGHVP